MLLRHVPLLLAFTAVAAVASVAAWEHRGSLAITAANEAELRRGLHALAAPNSSAATSTAIPRRANSELTAPLAPARAVDVASHPLPERATKPVAVPVANHAAAAQATARTEKQTATRTTISPSSFAARSTDSPRAIPVEINTARPAAPVRERVTTRASDARGVRDVASSHSPEPTTQSALAPATTRTPMSVANLARASNAISRIRVDARSSHAVLATVSDTIRIRLTDLARLPILPRVPGAVRIP